MHFRLLINNEDFAWIDASSQISNSIVLSVAQTPDEGIYIVGEEFFEDFHHVGFNVACFPHDLFLHGWEELLGLCQQNTVNLCMLLDISFGERIEGQ